VMIADQAEDPALGEDGDLVVERAIAKVKAEARGDAIAVRNLDQVAVRDGVAF
jgi:hypothetical protein